jgi:enterobacteria phage integrase
LNGKTKGLGRDFKTSASMVRAANTEIAKIRGETDLLNWVKNDGMTLAKWCEIFEKKSVSDGTRKPLTIKNFKSTMRVIKSSSFASKLISDIAANDIAERLDEIEKKTPSQAVLVRSRAMMLFKAAEAKGHIELGKNPVRPTDKPKVVVARARLMFDDFRSILEKVREAADMKWLENAMLLGLVSGQRKNDIANMLFSQVHDGFLWVHQGKGKSGHESKVRIPTAVYLPQFEISLDDVFKQCRDKVVSKHVIHHAWTIGRAKAGHKIMTDSISDAFMKHRDLAGVVTPEGKTPATFHEIRSLSARLYSDAYGEDFARALLGNKTGKMTALYRDSRGQDWTEVKLKAV